MQASPEPPEDPAAERHTRGLLERLLAGDRAAAETLFEIHREPLRRAIRPYFGRELRGVLDEDELLQRTYLRALLSIERFEWRGRGAFLAWLKGIALNLLRKELAAREAMGREVEGGDELAQRAPGREGTPSEAAMLREKEERLEDALHALSEEERELVTARLFLGQDYASLAADLGISEGGVRTKYSRALSRISRYLE